MPVNAFWTNAAIDVLLVIYVIDCAFMGLVIMMQRSKQEGLGAAFGGGMMEGAFGAETSKVLVKATVWAAAIFFVVSILLARLYTHRAEVNKEMSPLQQQLLAPVPASTNAVITPATPATNAVVVPAATAPAAAVPAPATPAETSTPAKATTPAASTPAKAKKPGQ